MGCSEIRYSEFAKSLNVKTLQNRIPFEGMIELTHRCNLKCVHCCCNEAAGDSDVRRREMSASNIFRILDAAERRGCFWLVLTGGEPFLREDFRDIYLYAKKKGFLVSIFTNATLVTPEIASVLKEWPPYLVEVTVYGASKDTYERVTGARGSFERCMSGIDNLHEADVKMSLKTIAMTINKEDVPGIKALARKLNADFRMDALIQSRIDGTHGPCRYRISPEEVVKFDTGDAKRREGWERLSKDMGDVETSDLRFDCGAGTTSFFVDPYGKMSICDMCRGDSYDIIKEGFDRIWEENFQRILKTQHRDDYKCRGCESVLYCDNCAGWAMMEEGDPAFVVEYLCDIGRMRSKAFNVKKEEALR